MYTTSIPPSTFPRFFSGNPLGCRITRTHREQNYSYSSSIRKDRSLLLTFTDTQLQKYYWNRHENPCDQGGGSRALTVHPDVFGRPLHFQSHHGSEGHHQCDSRVFLYQGGGENCSGWVGHFKIQVSKERCYKVHLDYKTVPFSVFPPQRDDKTYPHDPGK